MSRNRTFASGDLDCPRLVLARYYPGVSSIFEHVTWQASEDGGRSIVVLVELEGGVWNGLWQSTDGVCCHSTQNRISYSAPRLNTPYEIQIQIQIQIAFIA